MLIPSSPQRFATMKRVVVFSTLTALAPLALSCFGTFPLTKTVYNGNRNVYSSVSGDRTQRKLAQSAVMWLFIPVYFGAAVADAAVFNLIEFWTGNRMDVSYNDVQDGTGTTLTTSPDGKEAELTILQQGKVVAKERFVQVGDNVYEIRDHQGNPLGMVYRLGEGEVLLTDSQGRTLRTISAQEISAISKL